MEKKIDGQGSSKTRLLSTGAAQGCFLPPLLYFPHTTGCVSQDEKLFKLTDDATVVGLITDDESLYIASDGSASGEVFNPK